MHALIKPNNYIEKWNDKKVTVLAKVIFYPTVSLEEKKY